MELKVCDFVEVQHLGYDPVVYQKRKKSERSLPLIQKQLIDEPDNMVYKFYEGREYVILKQPAKAVVSLEAALLGILDGKHGYFAETLKTLLTAYEQVNVDPHQIILFTQMGIERAPEQPDFYLFKGFAHHNIGQETEVIDDFYEAIKRWENFVLTEVSQSNPIIEQRVWLVHYTLADALWGEERFDEAYIQYLAAIDANLPANSKYWKKLLNNCIALAIEFDDEPQIKRLLHILLKRTDTQLDMYFFRLEYLIGHQRIDDAQALLKWGLKTNSRVKKSPAYPRILKKFEL